METGRPSLRLFGLLAAVSVPGLVGQALFFTYGADLVASLGVGVTLALSAVLALAWAALVALLGGRAVSRDLREVLELAERGRRAADSREGDGAAENAMTPPQRRLAAALQERDRQIAALASDMASTPITRTATEAAAAVVGAARRVTGDPTWQLAVLHSAEAGLLPAGVYDDRPASTPGPVRDLHAWAASTEHPDAGPGMRARQVIGPWGAFMIVDASAGDQLSALLVAPWEGRAAPTVAELALLSLIGQHAAIAIEHALLYARLRSQTDDLNRMAVVQTDFLRGVSHDLQTPLTSIRALAGDLRETPSTDPAARIDLDTIAHQADRLRRMVGQLLTVSRLEGGAVQPRQEVFRGAPVVQRTWDALRAVDHRFELVSEGPDHLLVADPDRFEQVLWAVLDNAVKYSPPGSTVRVRLSSRPQRGADGLLAEVAITDQGMGMDPATLARATEQFFRADDARLASPDGSGVGLYAAHGLLTLMGGDLSIASRPGEGTTVSLMLPGEAADDADPSLLTEG